MVRPTLCQPRATSKSTPLAIIAMLDAFAVPGGAQMARSELADDDLLDRNTASYRDRSDHRQNGSYNRRIHEPDHIHQGRSYPQERSYPQGNDFGCNCGTRETEINQEQARKLALGANAAAIIATDTAGLAACGMQAGPAGLGMGILHGMLIGGIEATNATKNINARNRPRLVYGTIPDEGPAFSAFTVFMLVGTAAAALAYSFYGSINRDEQAIRRETIYLDANEDPDADDYNRYKTLMRNR